MKKQLFNYWLWFLAIVLLAILSFFKFYKTTYSSVFSSDNYVKINSTETESCLQCHQDTKGYSNYHNPELIGCASCHLGDISALNKEQAHKDMVLIPGNLKDAEQTCGKCHPNELKKIQTSLMTTNSGLVAVDKFVFGETDSLNYHYHIKDLKQSPSDKHLRDLCANCHLGAEKKEFGPIDELSRGGGCIACHLNYDEESKKGLETYINSGKKVLPNFHPATNIFVNDTHCFGCHSRSSRISTNYMGLQETLLEANDIKGKSNYTTLKDGRIYKHLQEDVHHNKGLLCIDCHSSHEVMGDGNIYAHAEDAVKVQCSDCHFKNTPNTINYNALDQESRLVYLHRNYTHQNNKIIVTEKSGNPLINTYVDTLGNAFLIGKKDRKLHPLKPQSQVCSRDQAHSNVSCSSCHSSWTSKCIGCHNQYDKNEPNAFDLLDKRYVKGQWKEYVAEFSSSAPAMGVREVDGKTTITPAIPGMIMTIDKGSYTSKANEAILFHRLYAPNSPHTTTKAVKDCKSCHSNSYAIGYGNGILEYKISNLKGYWQFTPEYALNDNDSLPEDAWIPFLKEVDEAKVNSTRTTFRPFTVKEQKRILLIGACLQCHTDDSKVMKNTIELGLDPVLKNITNKCILPEW